MTKFNQTQKLFALTLISAGIGIVMTISGCGGGGSSSGSGSDSSNTATVNGTLLNQTTNQAMSGILVNVGSTGLSATTDNNGRFTISNVPEGTETLSFSLNGTPIGSDAVTITGSTVSLGNIDINTEGSAPTPPSSLVRSKAK